MVVLTQIVLPPIALDSFIIMSGLLASIGTLYLAYDLLGRQHGPLQWLTLLITCGLVSALVLGSVNTIFQLLINNSFSLNETLQGVLIGGLMGVFTVVLVDAPKSQEKPRIVSRKGNTLGLAFGLIFFFTDLFLLRDSVQTATVLGVTCVAQASLWPYLTWYPSRARPHFFSGKGFGIGLLLGLLVWSAFFFLASTDIVISVLTSVPLAFACGGLISLWRFIHWEASNPQPHVFSRKGFLVGFAVGFIPWLMYFRVQEYARFAKQHGTGLGAGLTEMGLILVVVITAGAFALANAAAGSISQYILWKANTLPLRLLGAIGLVLILLSFGLQQVPAVIDLINNLGTSK